MELGAGGRARRCALLTACMLGAGALAATPARATPGDLDPTFSRDGLVRTQFGEYSQAHAVAIQPDGKIVVAGIADAQVALVRYRPDGRLDPTFSHDGLLRMRFGDYSRAGALAIQPDGKILVLGWSTETTVLARLKPSGGLDPSFSGDGLVTDFGDNGFADLALDPNGKIILAGATPGSRPDVAVAAVARFQPDGTPDTSFSEDGVASASFPGYEYGYGESVAVQLDGSPMLAGEVWNDDFLTTDLAVARFKPNGDLDPSFSGDGTTTLDIGGVDETRRIALRSNGRILAAGADCPPYDELYGNCVGEVVQFNPDGSLDDSFAEDGVRTLSLFRGRYVGSVSDAPALTQDGGTVLAGGTLTDRQGYGPVDFALARLDATGSTEDSFRGGGLWTTDFRSGDDDAHDVALQQDGKIVAAGSSDRQIALARYEVKAGPRDADADGVRGRADRCPVRFGDHPDGCTRYRRSLTMHFNRANDLYLGVIDSRERKCVSQQAVRVFRQRPGRDFQVDKTQTDGSGHWDVDARLHPGRYYAIAPRRYHRLFGICARARADGFRI
jgi:uncharacterized delta-60 repeat protein